MIAKFVKSIGYALKGIIIGIKEERNVRIDIVAAFYVLVFSHFYSFTLTQKVLLVAAGAAAAGVMLFWDVAVFKKILAFFINSPLMLLAFAATLFASYKFITYDKNKK